MDYGGCEGVFERIRVAWSRTATGHVSSHVSPLTELDIESSFVLVWQTQLGFGIRCIK